MSSSKLKAAVASEIVTFVSELIKVETSEKCFKILVIFLVIFYLLTFNLNFVKLLFELHIFALEIDFSMSQSIVSSSFNINARNNKYFASSYTIILQRFHVLFATTHFFRKTSQFMHPSASGLQILDIQSLSYSSPRSASSDESSLLASTLTTFNKS